MKEIIVKFEPFVFKQTVFIKDGEEIKKKSIPARDLIECLYNESKVSKIHFFGNVKYANKIKDEYLTNYIKAEARPKILINE